MSETELQSSIVELAGWCGYLVFHVHDSRKSTGPGFPDLVLVHKRTGRLLFVELKSEKGALSPRQVVWLDALRAGGHLAYEWRPADWTSGRIAAELDKTREAAA
jgi:hypothetical protein